MTSLEQIDLARAAAFRLGPIGVEPALRQVTGASTETLEPRVMQVLVVLAMANGAVISRDDLVCQCWEGRIVGDDAIQRVIGRLRKIAEMHGDGVVRIETITKVGYRLVGPVMLVHPTRPSPLTPSLASAGPAAIEPAAGAADPVKPADLPLPERPSLVVLPLANLSADPEQDYFVDAVTEDIISALSRWRWFFVIARNSSFAYRHSKADIRQVATELGVRYVISGSVRRIGDQVRVSIQLADATDGAQVWSKQFDRKIVDIFALQDDITEEVVRAIEPAVLLTENTRLARKPLTDYSAVDCFQRGLWHLNKVSRAHYEPAIASFRECIARDPALAAGHIGLARILYGGATVYGWSKTPAEDLQQAFDEAKTAILLDPDDSDAYFALSGAALFLNRHSEALAAARRSVALNPNSAYGNFRLAQVLVYAGAPAEALEPIQRSLRYSPFDAQMGAMLGTLALVHYQSRDYHQSAQQARAAIDNGFAAAHVLLAASLARLDRLDEARLALPPHMHTRVLNETIRMATYVNPADRNHLVHGLELVIKATTD